MSPLKYQEAFAAELTQSWLEGNQQHVRDTVRGLKNKSQAAYIGALIAVTLISSDETEALKFIYFMHPNKK